MLPRCPGWGNKPTSRVAQQRKKLPNSPQVFVSANSGGFFFLFLILDSVIPPYFDISFNASLLWLYFGRMAFEKVNFLPSFLPDCMLMMLWIMF